MSVVPYHIRIAILGDALEAGALGDVEIVSLHNGKADQAIQVVLHDRQTLRVFLIDLNLDGSITVDDGPYAPHPFHAKPAPGRRTERRWSLRE